MTTFLSFKTCMFWLLDIQPLSVISVPALAGGRPLRLLLDSPSSYPQLWKTGAKMQRICCISLIRPDFISMCTSFILCCGSPYLFSYYILLDDSILQFLSKYISWQIWFLKTTIGAYLGFMRQNIKFKVKAHKHDIPKTGSVLSWETTNNIFIKLRL